MGTPVVQSFKYLLIKGLRGFAKGTQTQKNINKQLKHADQRYQLKKYKWKPKQFDATASSLDDVIKRRLPSNKKQKRLKKLEEDFNYKYKMGRVEARLREILKPKYIN